MSHPNAFYLHDLVEVGHAHVPARIERFTHDGRVEVSTSHTGATLTVHFTQLRRPKEGQ